MNAIERMLTGEMDMPEFVQLLKNDSHVQDEIRKMIPMEAVDNKDNTFWTCISFDMLKKYNFDFFKMLCGLCKFDGTMGDNLNIFGLIRRAYMFSYPQVQYTPKYIKAFDLYLDVIKDCFDGPEVRCLVEQLIWDALSMSSKRKQIEKAKSNIRLQFHLTDTKKPRWIQGPEWPMGNCSPMRFLSQKRQHEKVLYSFEDVDTKEKKQIVQYY